MMDILIYLGIAAAIASCVASISTIIYLIAKFRKSSKPLRDLKKKEKLAFAQKMKELKKTYADAKKGIK